MKKISLTKGYYAIVSDEDFDRVNNHKWLVQVNHYKSRDIFYAARGVKRNGKRALEFMHNFILNVLPDGLDTDHINHDGLDNTRGNLRRITRSENKRNMPLSSRKPESEKIRMIPIYIRDSRIAELGGEKSIRDRCMEMLDVTEKLTEDRVY